jgi:hypothetical protein
LDLTDFLRLATVVLTGIPAGSQVLVATHIAPRLRTVDSATAFRMHDLLLHHDGHNAVAAAPSAAAAVAGAAVLIIDGVDDAAAIFTAVGIVGVILTGLTTARSAAPINNEIRRRLEAGETDDYEAMQARWRRAQRVRATAGPLAFVAMSIAAVLA